MDGDSFYLTRFLFQRSLAGIYFVGFAIALNQFSALCGPKGIEPMPLFLQRVNFWDAPSLFWLNQSNSFITVLSILGLALSAFALIGWSDAFGPWVSVGTWFALWVLYTSFVNVGQTFYGFGWEMLLLETGFLAIFLGPSGSKPHYLLIVLLQWLLFRLMFGAGLIKIRGDECWRDLTCMNYHYETMPLPGPTSWFFHRSPEWLNKAGVLFNHFVELIVPFFLFGPRLARHLAGALTVIFQLTIISSGNFSWLNHISVVIAIACFDDTWLSHLGGPFLAWARSMGVASLQGATDVAATGATAGAQTIVETAAAVPRAVIYGLTAVIGYLSLNPIKNLLSPGQMMNTSFDRFHLVNTYGAFGSITKVRNEVILEGSDSPEGPWKEYEFKGKPGRTDRMPPFVSPYHWKLDWQMWFAAMTSYHYHPWILNLVAKLLQGDPAVLKLMGDNPFPDKPPKYIRAQLYEYHYSKPGEKKWWTREYRDVYLPPLSLDNPSFHAVLQQQGWIE
jgi:hypothetical protein